MDNNLNTFRRMRTVIEGMYRILYTTEALRYGIAGKIGRVRKAVENKKGRYWVQVEGDVYDLEVKSLDPRIVSGLYKVNYNDIITSELFAELEVVHNRIPARQLEAAFAQIGVYLAPARKDPNPDVLVPNLTLQCGNFEARVFFPTVISDPNNGMLFYASDDKGAFALEFERQTGKNLWNILKVISLMELELCSCGSCQQRWEEWDAIDAQRLMCADCGNVLYYSRGLPVEPLEQKLHKLVSRNQGRSNAYRRMVEELKLG